MPDDCFHEEIDDPGFADRRNFYKVEKWSRDGQRIAELLFAGSASPRPNVFSSGLFGGDQGQG